MASISEILLAKGQDQAASARGRGNIYADLIHNLSSLPGQVVQHQRATDRAALQDRSLQEQIAGQAQERDLRGQQAARQQQADADTRGLQEIESAVFDADGNFDVAKAEALATERGMPHVIPKLREDAARWNATGLEAKKRRMELDDYVQEHAAADATRIAQNGYDLGTVQAWVTKRTADGFWSKDEGARKLAQAAEDPKSVIDPYVTKTPPKLTEHDPTKALVDATGKTVVTAVAKPEKVTFGTPTPVMVGGKRMLIRAGSDGAIYDTRGQKVDGAIAPDVPPNSGEKEPLVAIIGPDDRPVLVKRSEAVGKRPASTREQGRPVTSGDAGRIAEIDNSIDDLGRLKKAIGDTGETGTWSKLGAIMPNAVTDLTGIGTEAKQKQALIDRVKQVIGKALEGGVLRKEDELKYEKILPTIGDTSAVVKTKLDGLEAAIRTKRERTLESLGDAGYDVTRFDRTEAKPAVEEWVRDPKSGKLVKKGG